MAKIDIDEYLERDIYSIVEYMDGKYVHILSYAYFGDEDNGDGPYRVIEYCGFEIPLWLFVKNYHEDTEWFGNEECQTKQYIGDYTKEKLEEYWSDIPELKVLDYSELTMDTECGDYIIR